MSSLEFQRLKFEPGIHDINNNDYHASEGISRSAITEFKKSPLHYWDKYLSPEKVNKKPTASMKLGNAVHTLILEPHLFDKEFIVLEKKFSSSKKDKALKIEFDLKNSNKTIIEKKIYVKAKQITESILSHPKTEIFLKGNFCVEKSFFWADPDTGLLCKSRPDIWNQDINVLCDIKTAADSSPESFIFSTKKYDYHIQAAMQIDAIFETTGQVIDYFSFIVAPVERPYKPYIYTLSKDSIEFGRREYKNALKLIKKCCENKKWDLDRETAIELDLPFYALNSNHFHTLNEVYK